MWALRLLAFRLEEKTRIRLFAGTLMASAALLFAAVSSASALPTKFYGLMWSGDINQTATAHEMDLIRNSGAKYLRLEINWKHVCEQGWGAYDETFRLAAARSITILPYLYGRCVVNGASPGQKEAESKWYPTKAEYEAPGSPWEKFVYEAVHRYGYGGELWVGNPYPVPAPAWEVWNEPNFPENNPEGKQAQPENYGRFLKRTAQAIRAAQAERSTTGTLVLFGGLFSAATSKDESILNVRTFLERASKVEGVKTSYDGLSLHPYAFASGIPGLETNVNLARTALNEFGGTAKTLWITELGWIVGFNDKVHQPVNDPEQEARLKESFKWIASVAAAKNIQALLWDSIRDLPDLQWGHHMGLLRQDGTPRPSWTAFSSIAGGSGVWQLPFWHSGDNLGGNTVGDSDIASTDPNSIHIFARGADNTLQHKWFAGGAWSGWESLGGIMTSGPGAVAASSTLIHVVARTTGNAVTHWWWDFNTGWHSGDNLGGSIIGDPDIASPDPNTIHIFVRGADNALWHKWFAGGAWSGWENLGGTLTSSPSAVFSGGILHVVARTTGNAVTHWWWDFSTGWHSGDNLAGNITSDPDIASWGPNHLEVFARGADNALWHKRFLNNVWGEWEDLGGTLTSGPGAVSAGTEKLHVIGQTTGNTITHWWYSP